VEDATGDGTEQAEVVVVGAGPVGLTLANFLGLYGVRTLVLESRDELIDYPRGVGIDDETLRTFQALGLVDDVLPHTTPNQWLRFMTARGRCFASIEPRLRPYGWPRRNAFIQPLVDRVLLDGLARFPRVDVRWSHAVEGFDQDDDGVTVRWSGGSGGGSLRARYLVGTDGGRSIVRKNMPVTWDGTSSPTRWLVVDVRNDPVGTPNAYVHGTWRRPYVSISLPHGLRRFEFMLLPGEDEAEMGSRERVDGLLRAIHPDIGEVDYIRQRVYTHHARVASRFLDGRVLIAGDAAHLMPVWQGQGYNSGIRDAANLGWKLAAMVHGHVSPAVLDTYDTERRNHAAAMVKVSQAAGLLVRQTTRASAGVRDVLVRLWDYVPPLKRYIVEMRYKPMPRYTEGVLVGDVRSKTSPVGRLFPQPEVRLRAGASAKLDDVLGPWFGVLAWGHDPRHHLTDEARDVLASLGARVVVVRPATQVSWGPDDDDDSVTVGDESGAIKAWFDDVAGSVVVLRPDRFVAAVARPTTLSETLMALARVTGLTAQRPPVLAAAR
jgi:3-(3-hydroxy-phenyl)propionate hydroxylase